MKKNIDPTKELSANDMKEVNGGTIKQTLLDVIINIIKGEFSPKL
ncbi:hypothetical protein AAE250_19625 [Bacteroides sp. GD17]|jgi:bacteriocin-like protein|nr:hypothetical protein [uncultured Bacteroides sp.]